MKPVKVKTSRYNQATVIKTMDDSNAYALLSMYKDSSLAIDAAVKYPCRYFRKSHPMGLFFMSHLGREHVLMEWHRIVYNRIAQLASISFEPSSEASKVKVQGIRLDVLKTTKAEYEKWFRAEADQLHQIAGTSTKKKSVRGML